MLRPLADEVRRRCRTRAEHYAPARAAALHHLERAPVRGARRRASPPNGAVRLLEAGGERAEAELIGAALLELVRDGVPRRRTSPCSSARAEQAPLLAQVLEAYGIPVERASAVRARADTRLGAGRARLRPRRARRHAPATC